MIQKSVSDQQQKRLLLSHLLSGQHQGLVRTFGDALKKSSDFFLFVLAADVELKKMLSIDATASLHTSSFFRRDASVICPL